MTRGLVKAATNQLQRSQHLPEAMASGVPRGSAAAVASAARGLGERRRGAGSGDPGRGPPPSGPRQFSDTTSKWRARLRLPAAGAASP